MRPTFLFPLVLALSACSDSPAATLDKAEAAFAGHDYPAARVLLGNVLAAEPGNQQAQKMQILTLLALGDGVGAGAAIEKLGGARPAGELAEQAAEAALLRKAPDKALAFLAGIATPEADRLRALAAIQQGDLRRAGDLFASAIDKGGNARTFADYCRFRLMAGDIAGARDMAARATKVAPDGIDTLLVQGQLATRGGDLAAALKHFSRAEQLYPASLPALTGKAAVLGDLGRMDEMRKAIGRAQAFAPRDLTVVFLGARAAAADKDWAAVRGAVQPIEADLPPVHPLRLAYGEALFNLGQLELAMAQLRPVLTAQPGNREARRLLARAQIAGNDGAGALATIRPLADPPEATLDDLKLATQAAKVAGDTMAAAYAERARAPSAQSLGRLFADGDAAMRAGNWAGAAASYEQVLAQTDGRNVVVLNNLAYAQLMLGNHAKAVDSAMKALALAPGNPSVLDTAGWALFKSGKDRERALRLLRDATSRAPENLTIRAHLAEAQRARS